MGPLDNLLRPRSVAIIGASADAAKLAGRPLLYLEKYGFRSDIWPVNPRYEAIGGHRCYPEIAALPQPPDVAMVLVGMSKVTEAVRQLAAIGTETAIVLASGFGESGPEGKARQDELKQAAGAMRLLGPNTIGLVNVTDGVVLSASNALVTDDIIPGAIALVALGCAGDANPSPRPGLDFAKQNGQQIATAVNGVLTNAMTPVTGKLVCRAKQLELPLETLPTRAEWEVRARETNYIGSHARINLARLDRERDLVHGGEPAEALGQPFDGQHGTVTRWARSPPRQLAA
jgi:predicted CoA-binding protein